MADKVLANLPVLMVCLRKSGQDWMENNIMLDKNRWNALGIFYAITLTVTLALILFLSKIAHIPDPTWALISAVVCTELDLGQVRQVVVKRIFATIVGAGIAVAVLMILGLGYVTILTGVVLITLWSHYFIRVSNWKLATATGVIVLVVGLHEQTAGLAEHVAIQRALEVIAGSIIAGILSSISGKVFAVIQTWRKH